VNDIPIKHYSHLPLTKVSVITLYMPRLKLERFRKLYKSLKTPWKPLNWLILGYLIGIEDRYINIVAANTVDKAVRDYRKQYKVESGPEIVMKKTETGFHMSIGDVEDE